MISKYSVQPMKVLFTSFVFALLLQLNLVTPSQASTLRPVEQQRVENCQSKVQSGWRPYRIEADDTLPALAAQANITLEALMTANCLKTDQISAGALVLVPSLNQTRATAATAAPTTQEIVVGNGQTEAMAALAALTPAEVAVLSNALPMIKVISTTTAAEVATSIETTLSSELPNALPNALSNPLPAPSSPFSTANLVVVAIFALGAMGMLFFALRPRADDSAAARNLFSLLGNFVFLFAGLLVGVIVFPLLRLPSLTDLPTGVSAGVAVTLIGLLIVKEIFFGGQQWRTMSRLLNFGIVPLLMLFFLTVATRVAEMIN